MIFIRAEWRRTGWGGVTHPIALQYAHGRLNLVKPLRQEYSRTGRHGVWYYRADEVDVLLYIEQSNSGKRSVHISRCRLAAELCRRIEDTVRHVWLAGATTGQVEKILETLEMEQTAGL
jgi:hypothetical protein